MMHKLDHAQHSRSALPQATVMRSETLSPTVLSAHQLHFTLCFCLLSATDMVSWWTDQRDVGLGYSTTA